MKAADEAEFADFVRASSPSLLHTAWLLTGDAYLAEELVQEAFERALPKWRRIRADQPVAYVRRSVVNLNTDRWRRRRKEQLTRSGVLPERETAADNGPDDRDQIIRLLATLPKREREVIVLRHYADMTEHAVADALGISLGTVKSSASRGLATMRAALADTERVQS